MSIKVNPNLLGIKATEAKSLAAQLGSELAKVRSIYNDAQAKVDRDSDKLIQLVLYLE